MDFIQRKRASNPDPLFSSFTEVAGAQVTAHSITRWLSGLLAYGDERGRHRSRRRMGIAALPGFDDPAARQVRIDSSGHRYCGDRDSKRLASGDDLGLELGAVFAPARSPNASFMGDSVHVSTKS